jgi:hypothetical protein
LERAASIGPIVGDRRIFIVADEQACAARRWLGRSDGLNWTRLTCQAAEPASGS